MLKAGFDEKCNPELRKKPKDYNEPVDLTILSPCSKVLLQQIKRACQAGNHYSTTCDTFDSFHFDYYKLCQNGEPLKMRW